MDSAVVTIPAFNADSAYAYVARQVAFGPRVPNTEAHEQAARWLESELRRHGATVSIQKADLGAAQGNVLHSTNIMGSFNPEMGDRWLLLAHYDTRPQADKDPDPANHNKPIAGADAGAARRPRRHGQGDRTPGPHRQGDPDAGPLLRPAHGAEGFRGYYRLSEKGRPAVMQRNAPF